LVRRKGYSKYRAKKVKIDGIIFDSKKEGIRYLSLLAKEKLNEISNLELQVKYPCIVNDQKICTYIADFRYTDNNGNCIVEDVKSKFTQKDRVYRLKKKLIKALYDVAISEVL
jgi:hypothetical protein